MEVGDRGLQGSRKKERGRSAEGGKGGVDERHASRCEDDGERQKLRSRRKVVMRRVIAFWHKGSCGERGKR
jgi:hypothetical protein